MYVKNILYLRKLCRKSRRLYGKICQFFPCLVMGMAHWTVQTTIEKAGGRQCVLHRQLWWQTLFSSLGFDCYKVILPTHHCALLLRPQHIMVPPQCSHHLEDKHKTNCQRSVCKAVLNASKINCQYECHTQLYTSLHILVVYKCLPLCWYSRWLFTCKELIFLLYGSEQQA